MAVHGFFGIQIPEAYVGVGSDMLSFADE